MSFTVVHSSGRFDRSAESLIREDKKQRQLASIITRTELSRDAKAEQVLKASETDGWTWARSDLDHGQGECAVQWDTNVWELAGKVRAPKLSDMTWVRSAEYGGKPADPVHVLRVPLTSVAHPARKLTIFVVHMPLDNTELRAEIWTDCCKGLRAAVQRDRQNRTDVKSLINADWNKNFREVPERARIETQVARPLGMRQAWAGNEPASGGTHGPRGLIDGTVTNLRVRGARLLDDTPASDHRPYAVDLDWS